MPVWAPKENKVYWIDAIKPTLFTYDLANKQIAEYILANCFSFIDLAPNGKLCGILANDLVEFNVVDDQIVTTLIHQNLCRDPRVQFNDGKFDAKGRLWSGTGDAQQIEPIGESHQIDPDATFDTQQMEPIGKLYRIDPDGTVTVMDEGITAANGTDFNADFSKLYFTDSMAGNIYVYDFDLAKGTIFNKQVLIHYPEGTGIPDGITLADNGDIIVAVWAGWRVDRFSAEGQLLNSIKMPARNITCPTYAGHNKEILFVCSASFDLENKSDLGESAGLSMLVDNAL